MVRAVHFILIVALSSARFAFAAQSADLVLTHARVITLSTHVVTASAVAVTGERIVYVGDDTGAAAWVGKNTRVIDATGCTVTPGLVDAHGHLNNLGKILRDVNLIGTTSVADVVKRVRDYQAHVKPGEWIHGRGWDQNDWPVTKFPTWRDLAATEANPVYLDRVDGHAVWVNHRALELCGVTRATPDPRGGRIERDQNGEPIGVFVDEATKLVESRVPAPSPAALDDRLAAAIAECNRFGLTGVHDAGTTRDVFASLERLGQQGKLTLNIYSMIDSQDDAFAREILARGPFQEFKGRLTVHSFKLRADGALGSRGALLLEPYNDDPKNTGLNVQLPESLLAWTRSALSRGFQVGTHAIGDRANRIVLDTYEQAMRETGKKDMRLRVEHAQILSPQDIPRFAALGVVASMQPTHATSDMPWAEKRVGAARLHGAYAWRSLLDSGAVLAFGSDFPVESENPLLGLYAAVTRQDAKGNPPGGWFRDQKLTLDEALRAFTIGAAYARFDEKDAGKIEVGMRADLTVFDRDITSAAPRDLLVTQAKYTITRGRVVYERP
ncbi:MAG TPA: amidohydrolase [Candidatus Krumholzibacteria bacterium]|nr:amidohydrolase [Candidatus Krumholzibacteria bacterium]